MEKALMMSLMSMWIVKGQCEIFFARLLFPFETPVTRDWSAVPADCNIAVRVLTRMLNCDILLAPSTHNEQHRNSRNSPLFQDTVLFAFETFVTLCASPVLQNMHSYCCIFNCNIDCFLQFCVYFSWPVCIFLMSDV